MPHRYTFFMLLQATPRSRALGADDQREQHDALLMRVFEACMKLPAFSKTQPSECPDAE